MKHIQYGLEENLFRNRQFNGYFSGRRTGVLDIETTGLDRRRNAFVLGGLFDVEEGTFHQILAQNTGEEGEALEAFARLIKPLDVVITYNGRNFDMPFLEERGRACGKADMPRPYDLDLYQLIRWNSPLKGLLPNLKQTTVEAYMGLWVSRTDEITGAESVDLYREYARTGNEECEKKILLHNSDDVCQLTRLTRVIEKCDMHKAMHSMGFPAGPPGKGLTVSKIRIAEDRLVISGEQRKDACQFRSYEMDGYPAEVAFAKREKSFEIRLPLKTAQGLKAVDVRGAGLEESQFENYPSSSSGFLVVSEGGKARLMECNHLARAFIDRIVPQIYG